MAVSPRAVVVELQITQRLLRTAALVAVVSVLRAVRQVAPELLVKETTAALALGKHRVGVGAAQAQPVPMVVRTVVLVEVAYRVLSPAVRSRMPAAVAGDRTIRAQRAGAQAQGRVVAVQVQAPRLPRTSVVGVAAAQAPVVLALVATAAPVS